MWLLPTWKRPELCQQALDACARTGMTSPGVIFVDPPYDGYEGLRADSNWQIYFSPEHVGMAEAHRWILREFPDEKSYGFIADDNIPVTSKWDAEMEESAGDWCLVDCADDYLSHTYGKNGALLCGAVCSGGELIRSVGWWALPGVYQAGIDDAWVEISKVCLKELNLRVRRDDVLVEHLQFRTGRRPQDETDTVNRLHGEGDMNIVQEFRGSAELHEIADRVRSNVQL